MNENGNCCNALPPPLLSSACICAYENLSVCSDLLDRINVFPVADGDTGANLRMSLSPFRECEEDVTFTLDRLRGVGNSGNIAVAFLREFLRPDADPSQRAKRARTAAYRAIAKPRAGTMLEVFDALHLLAPDPGQADFPVLRKTLVDSVLTTTHLLQELTDAGVVDAGALGMFIFLDGFFSAMNGQDQAVPPLGNLFGDSLQVNASFSAVPTGEHCVEAMLSTTTQTPGMLAEIAALGRSAVVLPEDAGVKLHLHTRDPQELQDKLKRYGELSHWSDEVMDSTVSAWGQKSFARNRVRIMSDGAASLPRGLARKYGILLLDSYILSGEQMFPETLCVPDTVYQRLRAGERVSTAQASNRERHLSYQVVCEQFGEVLYLATGAAYTGNVATAAVWEKEWQGKGKLHVVDSGAASGRLALMAILAAMQAEKGLAADEVLAYVHHLVESVQEYVFIDQLKYLVAGGRVSKPKGMLGDLLHRKPIISPEPAGVQKHGTVKNRTQQLDFALDKLDAFTCSGTDLFILLQYTDNRAWLQKTVEGKLALRYPDAEILLVPLSLTSGVHMGPGTWSIAFAEKGAV